MKLFLHHYAEFFCLLISLYCYKQTKYSVFRWFPPFLLLTLCSELLATYIAHEWNLSNQLLYKALTTIAFVFYLFVLSSAIKNRILKKYTFKVILLLVAIIFIQVFTLPVNVFHREAYLFGSCILVFYCFYYLYEIITGHDIDFKIEKEPFFWIVLGLLFFYLVGSAFIIFVNSFPKSFRDYFSQIMRWLSLIMYSCFAISFLLCRINNENYFSSSLR